MVPPLVSFVTWNRMGLTVRNLSALLNTPDDFELHIVDNHSQDETWMYLESISDSRIKSRTRFDVNRGPVYAVNFNLAKRKKEQFFITVDNDVHVCTPDWVSRFMTAFEVFPEVGLLGAVRKEYYERHRFPAVKKQWESLYYYRMVRGYVEGCFQCLRPVLLDRLGYWSEENCMGDVEMCYRILKFTDFQIGYFPSIEIDQAQFVSCAECQARNNCKYSSGVESCFDIYKRMYRNPQFRNKFYWKYEKCLSDMEKDARTAYCASIHDVESMKDHAYNRHMAEENFRYYIEYAN